MRTLATRDQPFAPVELRILTSGISMRTVET